MLHLFYAKNLTRNLENKPHRSANPRSSLQLTALVARSRYTNCVRDDTRALALQNCIYFSAKLQRFSDLKTALAGRDSSRPITSTPEAHKHPRIACNTWHCPRTSKYEKAELRHSTRANSP